jgi:outer membrane receptor for ferrienterochelin and colicins
VNLRTFFSLCLIASFSTSFAQSIIVSGTITDATNGGPLIGTNVIVAVTGTSRPVAGAVSDFDGRFVVEDVPAGSYDLVVRFVGYAEARQAVTLAAGDPYRFDFELASDNVSLNTVVVTASKQEEKVLDAPASVSVLSARDVEDQATASTAATMRHVTSLDMAQTGADRFEIVLRGFNNAFSGATFTLVDYRQGAVASLGVNAWIMMPISNIDTERIEIVRGAGSALYGAGVDAGVIHVVTKGPFTSPGTTVSLLGGEHALLGFNGRHAGVAGDRLGYKIAGAYTKVNDWEMDVLDPVDFFELDANGDGIVAYDGAEQYYQLTEDGEAVDAIAPELVPDALFDIPRDYDTYKWNLNGMLEYRVSALTSLIVNAGHMSSKSPILTGIGTAQADGFGYTYGQVRVRSGRFFAQAYMNKNNMGDSYIYGTGNPLIDNSRLVSGQAQYDFSLLQDRERIIVGVDYEQQTPDTEGTIYGRNEDDDTVTELGTYIQSMTRITSKLDLTLAGRLDHSNIYDDVQFSPRAALVYKPTAEHSLRATYNRAFSSPGNTSLFLDLVAGQNPVSPPDYIILARGRGSRDGFTFRRDAALQDFANSDLVATSNLPFEGSEPVNGYTYDWNTDVPVGADLEFIYGLVYQGLSQLTLEEVEDALGVTIPPALFPILVDQFSPANTVVEGWVDGVLAKPAIEGGANVVSDATDIQPLTRALTETIEVGYKGILGDRLLVAVDAYRSNRRDFGGPLLFESPVVLVPTLSDDLTDALAMGITDNVGLSGLLAALQAANPDNDFSPEAVAAAIATLAGESLPGPSDPVAIVQPSENLDGPLGPELMLGYRNFGDIDFWGVDISTQLIINDKLNAFANYSYVSDNFFTEDELGSPGNQLALNAPQHKAKAGIKYSEPLGVIASLSGRYIDTFPVLSGPYVGIVPSYFLLDIGGGYDFGKQFPGLRVDLLIQNVLNNKHREFVGAPKLGRFTTLRATYSL